LLPLRRRCCCRLPCCSSLVPPLLWFSCCCCTPGSRLTCFRQQAAAFCQPWHPLRPQQHHPASRHSC
jgi:hypothetical protein